MTCIDSGCQECASDQDFCHCGKPVRYGYDGDPNHHRGMCADCDAVRCDVDPTECPNRVRDVWADERADVLARFAAELAKATGDGSKKRRSGIKPPWYEDDAHEAAIFSHLTKWKRGELVDPDSGAHPLVHLAWRALAIACRESGNTP
jgi:hypothetical protein